jgi:hypothetical protein
MPGSIGELISISRSAVPPVLAHLLEMARLEAGSLVKQLSGKTPT